MVVLGEGWEDAAAIFAGFALLGIYIPVCSIATWLLTSQGRGRDFLISSSISSFLAILSFLVGLPFGPIGVAFSYSLFSLFLNLPVVYYISGRQGPVRTKILWQLFFRHLPIWFIVCATTAASRYIFKSFSSMLQLGLCIPLGLIAAVIFIYFHRPGKAFIL